MANRPTNMNISPDTLRLLREIKEIHGVAFCRQVDRAIRLYAKALNVELPKEAA